MTVYSGHLHKMHTQDDQPVRYQLELGDQMITMNDLLGKKIRLNFSGTINCSHCGRKTKKSYSQGYCYPCFTKLARCDTCIMSPEKCHFHAGTCREPEWGEQFCFQDHIVYLANSSGLKVGITRETQIPTRWMDQGAMTALPILRVKTRLQSGLVEDAIRKHTSDRTNWRNMLKGVSVDVDLKAAAAELIPQIQAKLDELAELFGATAIEQLDEDVVDLDFPVTEYPTKISSFNFDKDPEVSGVLEGIKGQYLIFDKGVINIRKFTSYEVAFEAL